MTRLTKNKAIRMLKKFPLIELGRAADELRLSKHPEGIATFVVDRNINYTNVCINRCSFCAFWRSPSSPEAYILEMDEIFSKIEETVRLGGTQILLQGGLHPDLSIDFYIVLLSSIKRRFAIDIHGFSPPEIAYIADSSNLTLRETLEILKDAGLDSIPGGGAEILSDRVRQKISPKKIGSNRWLSVMETAHGIGFRTTATMMFGSIEEPEDIVEHLNSVRELQDRTGGFTAFIPWSFQPGNTEINKRKRINQTHIATAVDYLRILAVSRLFLDNFDNIQASWVTQGLKMAQIALRFGANDFGSTMIEENVVASTGVSFETTLSEIIHSIRGAGFRPVQRNNLYSLIKFYDV